MATAEINLDNLGFVKPAKNFSGLNLNSFAFPKVDTPKLKSSSSSKKKTTGTQKIKPLKTSSNSSTKKLSSSSSSSNSSVQRVAATNEDFSEFIKINKDGSQSLQLPNSTEFYEAVLDQTNIKKPDTKANILSRGSNLLQIFDGSDYLVSGFFGADKNFNYQKKKEYLEDGGFLSGLQAKIQNDIPVLNIAGSALNSGIDKVRTVVQGKEDRSYQAQVGSALATSMRGKVAKAREDGLSPEEIKKLEGELSDFTTPMTDSWFGGFTTPEGLLNLASIAPINQLTKMAKIDNLLDVSKFFPKSGVKLNINSNTSQVSSILESALPDLFKTDLDEALVMYVKQINFPANTKPTLQNVSRYISQNIDYAQPSDGLIEALKLQEQISNPNQKITNEFISERLLNQSKSLPDSELNIITTADIAPKLKKISQEYNDGLNQAIKTGDVQQFNRHVFNPPQVEVRNFLNKNDKYVLNLGENYSTNSLKNLGLDEDQFKLAQSAQTPASNIKSTIRGLNEKIDKVLSPLRARIKPNSLLEEFVQSNLDFRKVSKNLQSDISNILKPKFLELDEVTQELFKTTSKEELAGQLKKVFLDNPNYKINNVKLGDVADQITPQNVLFSFAEFANDWKTGRNNKALQPLLNSNPNLQKYLDSVDGFSKLNRELLLNIGVPENYLYNPNFKYIPHVTDFNRRDLASLLEQRKLGLTLLEVQKNGKGSFISDPLSAYFGLNSDMVNIISQQTIALNANNMLAYQDSLLSMSPTLQKNIAQYSSMEDIAVNSSEALFKSALGLANQDPTFFSQPEIRKLIEEYVEISKLPSGVVKQNQINELYIELLDITKNNKPLTASLEESQETIKNLLNFSLEGNLNKLTVLQLEGNPEALLHFKEANKTLRNQLSLIFGTNNNALEAFRSNPEYFLRSIVLDIDSIEIPNDKYLYDPVRSTVANNPFANFQFSNLNPKGLETFNKSAQNLFSTPIAEQLPKLKQLISENHLLSKASDILYDLDRLFRFYQLEYSPSFVIKSNWLSNFTSEFLESSLTGGIKTFDPKFRAKTKRISNALFAYENALESKESKTAAEKLIESIGKVEKLSPEENQIFKELTKLPTSSRWNEMLGADWIDQIAMKNGIDLSLPIKDKSKFSKFIDEITRDRTGFLKLASRSDNYHKVFLTLSELEKTGSISQSVETTKSLFKSIDDMTVPEQFLYSRLTSFLFWRGNNYSFVSKKLLTDPIYRKNAITLQNIIQATQTSEEEREARNQLPTDDYRKNPFYINLFWGGEQFSLDVSSFNPLAEAFSHSRLSLMSEGPAKALQELSSSFNLPISVIYTMMTGTDAFSGRNINPVNGDDYSFRQVNQGLGRALSWLPEWAKRALEFTETEYTTQSGRISKRYTMNGWANYILNKSPIGTSTFTRLNNIATKGEVEGLPELIKLFTSLDFKVSQDLANQLQYTSDEAKKQEILYLLIQARYGFLQENLYMTDEQKMQMGLPYNEAKIND